MNDDYKVYCQHSECRAFATAANARKLQWDWFTGFLPRTSWWCAKHANSRERNLIFEESRRHPPETTGTASSGA